MLFLHEAFIQEESRKLPLARSAAEFGVSLSVCLRVKRWTHDFCLFALVTHRSLLRACVHGARDSQVTDALVLCDDVTGERE